MMTIKRVGEDGHETVESVLSAEYNAKTNTLTVVSMAPVQYTSGLVWVMNEHGKTVAAYDLTKQKQKGQNHG